MGWEDCLEEEGAVTLGLEGQVALERQGGDIPVERAVGLETQPLGAAAWDGRQQLRQE